MIDQLVILSCLYCRPIYIMQLYARGRLSSGDYYPRIHYMDVDLHWRFAVCLSNGVHRGISADKGIVLLLPKTIDIHVFF